MEEPPTAAELAEWRVRGEQPLPVRRLFNTSGKFYRELGVKARLDAGMGEDEALELLSTNGMLVKRPLVVSLKKVLVGFKEQEWEQRLLED